MPTLQPRRNPLALLVLLPLAALFVAGSIPEARAPRDSRAVGVVLTGVAPERAGARSGLKPGDILFAWRWAANAGGGKIRGTFSVPLEFYALEDSRAPEGKVVVVGTREGEPLEVTMAQGDWSASARPNFTGDDLAAFQKGDKGDTEAWRAMAEGLPLPRRAAEASWLWCRLGDTLTRAKKAEAARAASTAPSPPAMVLAGGDPSRAFPPGGSRAAQSPGRPEGDREAP